MSAVTSAGNVRSDLLSLSAQSGSPGSANAAPSVRDLLLAASSGGGVESLISPDESKALADNFSQIFTAFDGVEGYGISLQWSDRLASFLDLEGKNDLADAVGSGFVTNAQYQEIQGLITNPQSASNNSSSSPDSVYQTNVLDNIGYILPEVPNANGYRRVSDTEAGLLLAQTLDSLGKTELADAVRQGRVSAEKYSSINLALQDAQAAGTALPAVNVSGAVVQQAKDLVGQTWFKENTAPLTPYFSFKMDSGYGLAVRNYVQAMGRGNDPLWQKAFNGERLTDQDYRDIWHKLHDLICTKIGATHGVEKDIGNNILLQGTPTEDGYVVFEYKAQLYVAKLDPGQTPTKENLDVDNVNVQKVGWPDYENGTVPMSADGTAEMCFKYTSRELDGQYLIDDQYKDPLANLIKALPQGEVSDPETLIASIEHGGVSLEQQQEINNLLYKWSDTPIA